MNKLKIWAVLVVMALGLSACASPVVKCPECQHIFDSDEHTFENYGK